MTIDNLQAAHLADHGGHVHPAGLQPQLRKRLLLANTPDEEVHPDSAWQRFRNWRRSRPFWGGLLLALAGLELIGIPLLSILAHGSVKVVIYIGIGGVFGVLIGGLLVACGLLIWFHPVQRVFYSVAGVLLAIASFVTTNLGGFFLGMLLGVIGASLSFGWTRIPPGPAACTGQCGRAVSRHPRAWAWCCPAAGPGTPRWRTQARPGGRGEKAGPGHGAGASRAWPGPARAGPARPGQPGGRSARGR